MNSDEPRLLYVEDEALVALVVAMSLEEAGFEVQLAADGVEAIKALDEGASNFHALVTDVRLPEVDGWNIARHARKLNATLPVVYVSEDSASQWAAKGVP